MAESDGDTKAFESAQALFCAMADLLGSSKAKAVLNLITYKTYEEFKSGKGNQKLISDSYVKLRTTGVSLEVIEKILYKDVDWYKSSVNIAIKLIEDLGEINSNFKKIANAGWDDFFYYRGAAGGKGVMEDIGLLFTIANKHQKLFGDINKWCPADIYFASTKAEKIIQNTLNDLPPGFNFVNLNELVNSLMCSGDLLGVSLKKAPKQVHIYKINFTQSLNAQLLENVKYLDISDNRGADRDIQIFFGNSKSKPLIKIRHDPYSGNLGAAVAIKCEIEGKNSRLGSLSSFGTANPGGTGLTDLWSRVDPVYAKKLSNSFIAGAARYKKSILELNAEYAEKVKKNNSSRGEKLKAELKEKKAPKILIEKILKTNKYFDYEKKLGITNVAVIMNLNPTLYEAYQNERIHLSVIHIIGSFEGLIRDYFSEGVKVKDVTANVSQTNINLQIKKNNVILEIYKYVSAMSPSSGKFIIAK